MRAWRHVRRGVVVAVVLVAAGAVGGCRRGELRGCPVELTELAHEDFVDVQAAALWWWIDRVESPSEVGWVFVSVEGEDIGDDVLAQLRHQYWMRPRYWRMKALLQPGSMAVLDAQGVAHDLASGEQGTQLSVSGTRFSSPTSATSNVGVIGLGAVHGGSTEVSLRCSELGWRVSEAG